MTDLAISTLRPAAAASRPAPRAVALWLWSVAALVFLMVVVGGATRLTESGLSITEWKPIAGVLPPLSQTAWAAEFEKYKHIPQYAELFPTMTLGEFKFIFFWEWTHRLIGRLLGLVMALPLAWFWIRGHLPAGLKPKLLGVLALGGLQGVVGWWMVSSGLTGRVEVAQERLATHLVLASITFAVLVWLAASVGRVGQVRAVAASPRRHLATLVLGVTLLQIGLGGLVAGLRAGMTYNTWPLMDGRFVPPAADLAQIHPLWRNLVDNVTTVQFDHRMTAYALLALALAQALVIPRAGRGWVFAALVAVQASLGILTLVLAVPLPAALLHQAFAMVVLAAATLGREALAAPQAPSA